MQGKVQESQVCVPKCYCVSRTAQSLNVGLKAKGKTRVIVLPYVASLFQGVLISRGW